MRATTMRPLALAFTIGSALGGLTFARRYFDALANAQSRSPWPILLDELSAAWIAALLLLGLFKLARRYPVSRWWWAYAGAAPLYAMTHTLAMFGSRSLLYPLFGLGAYHYGDLRWRFLMEAPVQLMAYAITLVAIVILAQVRRAREAERLEALLNEARLERLRLSIAPHFLFNALNVISSTAYESPAKADALVTRLSNLLRAVLRTDTTQLCSLREEIDLMEEYLAIQRARFEDYLEVDVVCAPAVKEATVPRLILQPIVENALVHGLDGEGRVTTRIEARRHGDRLNLTVSDRGKGPPASLKEGIGLRNTRERLQALFGNQAHFTLTARDDAPGALATIEIPWQCAS